MSHKTIFIIASFLLIYTSQCSAVYDIVSKKNCLDSCSHRGLCIWNGTSYSCECANNLYSDNCSQSAADLSPSKWIPLQVILCILCGTEVALSVAAFIFSSKQMKTSEVSTLSYFKTRRLALVVLTLASLINLLHMSIDPSGMKHRVPYLVVQLLGGFIFPLIAILYSVIIFHWIEIYYQTVNKLKQEEMLRKVNKNYSQPVTLEDILSQVSFVKKLRIPFLLVNGVGICIQVIRDVIISEAYTEDLLVNPRIINYVWGVTFIVIWVGQAIGFLVFGRRLVALMPTPLQNKMKRVTLHLQVQAAFLIVASIVVLITYAVNKKGVSSELATAALIRFIFVVIIFVKLLLFMRFHKRFPFCFHVEGSERTTASSDIQTAEASV